MRACGTHDSPTTPNPGWEPYVRVRVRVWPRPMVVVLVVGGHTRGRGPR